MDFYVYYKTTKDFFSYEISPYFAVLPKVKSEGQYFIYPPTFLIFFAPLTVLPINIAEKLWIILNISIFFLAGYWFTTKILNIKKTSQKLILFLMLYNFNPFFLCIFIGQIDILILFFLYLSFYFIVKNRENFIGIIVGILTLIKLTPIIFSLYFLIKLNLRAVRWLIFTISIFVIISLLVFPAEIYSEFFAAISTVSQNSDRYIMPLNKSIFGLLGRIFLDNRLFNAVIIDSPALFYLFYFFVFLALLTIIFLRRTKLNNLEIFSLVIILSAIILPNALVYSLVFVFPAILIFYGKIKTSRGLFLFCLIFLSITFHYSLYSIVPFGFAADFVPLLGNLILFNAIAFNIS
ncbi:MAG: glycosyltransferase family 87 protein [Elusimicrobiota bacterium]